MPGEYTTLMIVVTESEVDDHFEMTGTEDYFRGFVQGVSDGADRYGAGGAWAIWPEMPGLEDLLSERFSTADEPSAYWAQQTQMCEAQVRNLLAVYAEGRS